MKLACTLFPAPAPGTGESWEQSEGCRAHQADPCVSNQSIANCEVSLEVLLGMKVWCWVRSTIIPDACHRC